jgi:hypothetical protein
VPFGTSTALAPHTMLSVSTNKLDVAASGGHIGGAAALPGGIHEAGVAVAPEERASATNTELGRAWRWP